MRVIKFKAKNLGGVWVYGSFDSHDTTIISETGQKYYIQPETLCQFVGITDRNGVEVYEDDLVQSQRGNTGRVVSSDLAAGRMGERTDVAPIVLLHWGIRCNR